MTGAEFKLSRLLLIRRAQWKEQQLELKPRAGNCNAQLDSDLTMAPVKVFEPDLDMHLVAGVKGLLNLEQNFGVKSWIKTDWAGFQFSNCASARLS